MMKSLATLLPFALLATAAPSWKRGASSIDLTVLQFAHVLEQLETCFYTEALQKFQESDFISAGFTSADVAIQQFQNIQSDEATHTSVLEQTIRDQGGEPLSNCQFNFGAALSDVATMAATARTVELVGVAAYLGAASLVQDPQLLTAAASILTVEARHQSILNVLSGAGVAIPAAFDIPLSPPQILALAGSFISGCDLGIKGNTPLSITNTGTVGVGTSLTFDMSSMSGTDTSNFTCQMLTGGSPFALALPLNDCVVPDISGPVAIFIVDNKQPLLNNQLDQFAASIKMGPTLAFIDSKTETLPQLARSGGPTSDTTSVISPAEASSVQQSATSTAGASESTASSSSASTASGSGQQASANVPIQQPGGPNFAVGKSGDGHTIVNGWQNLPAGVSAPSS